MDLARTGKSKAPKTPRMKARWKKPGQNVLKLNIDASFREVEMNEAIGLVVGDWRRVDCGTNSLVSSCC
jgi:hypothetical protein